MVSPDQRVFRCHANCGVHQINVARKKRNNNSGWKGQNRWAVLALNHTTYATLGTELALWKLSDDYTVDWLHDAWLVIWICNCLPNPKDTSCRKNSINCTCGKRRPAKGHSWALIIWPSKLEGVWAWDTQCCWSGPHWGENGARSSPRGEYGWIGGQDQSRTTFKPPWVNLNAY